jgi:hypothetical protein
MNTDFDIDFFSDNKYEELTVEISYKGQILCQMNKDKGIEHVEVEFFPDLRLLPGQIDLKFPLDEFIELLIETKKDLLNS